MSWNREHDPEVNSVRKGDPSAIAPAFRVASFCSALQVVAVLVRDVWQESDTQCTCDVDSAAAARRDAGAHRRASPLALPTRRLNAAHFTEPTIVMMHTDWATRANTCCSNRATETPSMSDTPQHHNEYVYRFFQTIFQSLMHADGKRVCAPTQLGKLLVVREVDALSQYAPNSPQRCNVLARTTARCSCRAHRVGKRQHCFSWRLLQVPQHHLHHRSESDLWSDHHTTLLMIELHSRGLR